MKAVILAGGLGTRLAEETNIKPKPLVQIGEKPILWHIMKIYLAHGIKDFIICCGYKGHLIKEYLKGGFEHELKREIIATATDKKHLTYLECKHQFALGVLEKSEYLNDNILGKFFDKDFV